MGRNVLPDFFRGRFVVRWVGHAFPPGVCGVFLHERFHGNESRGAIKPAGENGVWGEGFGFAGQKQEDGLGNVAGLVGIVELAQCGE